MAMSSVSVVSSSLLLKMYRKHLESLEYKRSIGAKRMATEDMEEFSNKDDPLTSFSFAVKAMKKKSKPNPSDNFGKSEL